MSFVFGLFREQSSSSNGLGSVPAAGVLSGSLVEAEMGSGVTSGPAWRRM